MRKRKIMLLRGNRFYLYERIKNNRRVVSYINIPKLLNSIMFITYLVIIVKLIQM